MTNWDPLKPNPRRYPVGIIPEPEIHEIAKALVDFHASIADPAQKEAFERIIDYTMGGKFENGQLLTDAISKTEPFHTDRLVAQLHLIKERVNRWCKRQVDELESENELPHGKWKEVKASIEKFSHDVSSLCGTIQERALAAAMLSNPLPISPIR